MEQGKITVAYKAVLKLYRIEGLPFSLSSKLFMLKKNLQPYFDHQREKQLAVLEACGATEDQGELPPGAKVAFMEIIKSEVDYNDEPVEIVLTPELTEKLVVTGELIEQLEGFINFVEG